MPQTSYLSPGVYVEEIDTGNKPIEGVSTSTTGLVGATERGPANVPTLVTSFGEFRRLFGSYLPIDQFTDPTGRAHCYLPHAVEGFFTNGGKRAYLVRVTAEEAARADRRLFFRDLAVGSPPPTVLLRPAEEGTGTAVNPPALYALSLTSLAVSNAIRIGDGSRSEYRTIAALDPTQRHVSLNLPLQRAHPAAASVQDVVRTVDTTTFATGDFQLAAAVKAGSTQILVSQGATPGDLTTLAGLAGPELIEIGTAPAAEYVQATAFVAVGTTQVRLTLANPLQRNHDSGIVVTALQVPAGPGQVLAVAANGGDSILYLDALGGNFTNTAHLAVVEAGAANQEVRRIGTLSELALDLPPYEDYPISSVIEHVTLVDDDRNVTASTTNSATLNDVSALEPGMSVVFDTGTAIVATVDNTTKTVTFLVPLAAAPTVASTAQVQPRKLTAPAAAGSIVLSLDARVGLSPGDVIRAGVAPNHEFVTVRQLSDPQNVPPDAGAVVIDGPLRRDHASSADVHRQAPATADPARQASYTLLDGNMQAKQLLVADGTSYAAGEIVRITLPSGDMHYHRIGGASASTPGSIELDVALIRSHAAGNTLVVRQPLFVVRALDTGSWGNRVLISVAAEETGLLARAEVTAATASPGPGIPSTLRLTTVTGVEAGTVLELRDPADSARIGDFIKVKHIDRAANNLVVLDAPGLSAAHIAAFTAAGAAGKRLVAHSKEFRLEVLLLPQPNPAVPIRNEVPIDRELFLQLSMDQRHSRYFERIIGSTFTDGASTDDLGQPLRRSDRRSEGGSAYVRVHDLGTSDADRERVRLWPETLVDQLPSGLLRPARHRLGEGESKATFGDDSIATMADPIYEGVDDREPDRRTGIFALKNIESISLVATPGQVSVAVQQALIDHCEELRYRFAVLDARGPADDTLDDVQAQRQQFDTKYAAFYHPWLTIPDPFPANLAAIGQFPIAPSGHVLGIYARTDDARGVHKAPANEVVSGLTGLTRYLNQREQDVLNAYPVNIDVIRDFRANNRGIRIWGARCITSDSDWKYVNVRRLLIFIEDSIDRGLQWVVFEPNSEELWARVRRVISNFLTTVWRNGALEGTTREQAFYVKCDRTTMTQTDIDNGRLICVIGVAPVKPAEFVIIRIGLWTADANS
jgi:phage tail sheath protein FI